MQDSLQVLKVHLVVVGVAGVVCCPDICFSRGVTTTTTTYLNQVRRTEQIALCVRRSQRISEQLVLVMFPLVTKHIAGKALWGTT